MIVQILLLQSLEVTLRDGSNGITLIMNRVNSDIGKKKKKNFRAKMESFQIDINRIKPFRCKSMKIIIYGISSFPAEIQGIEKPINRREELVSPRSNSVHGSSIS